jgi:hypothetical protein
MQVERKDLVAVAAIDGFTPAMESEGRQEGLVLALQALSRFHAEAPARPAAGYELISGLTGIMFMTATSFSQPCPAWWILGSRDTYLSFATHAIGLRVESLGTPPEELDSEGQMAFFRETLVPAIRTEIEAGRPVLVNGGFPGFGWGLWGVATRLEEDKVFGHTCWFQYNEQPVGEEFPVMAAYAVHTRDRTKRIPIRDILQHAADLYDNKGETGWTTGPGAYEHWMDHLERWTPCSESCVDLPNCHRQMALFVRDARRTAARFLDFLNEELPTVLRRFIPDIVQGNHDVARLLNDLATSEDPATLLGDEEGRKKCKAALAEAMKIEIRLGKQYAKLAAQKEWDAPTPVKKKSKGSRSRSEKRRGEKARGGEKAVGDKARGEKAVGEKAKQDAARAREELRSRGWRKLSD